MGRKETSSLMQTSELSQAKEEVAQLKSTVQSLVTNHEQQRQSDQSRVDALQKSLMDQKSILEKLTAAIAQLSAQPIAQPTSPERQKPAESDTNDSINENDKRNSSETITQDSKRHNNNLTPMKLNFEATSTETSIEPYAKDPNYENETDEEYEARQADKREMERQRIRSPSSPPHQSDRNREEQMQREIDDRNRYRSTGGRGSGGREQGEKRSKRQLRSQVTDSTNSPDETSQQQDFHQDE